MLYVVVVGSGGKKTNANAGPNDDKNERKYMLSNYSRKEMVFYGPKHNSKNEREEGKDESGDGDDMAIESQ